VTHKPCCSTTLTQRRVSWPRPGPLSIDREKTAYGQLFDAFGDDIDPALVARMVAPDGPAADNTEVRLLPISAVDRHVSDVDAVLATLEGDASFRFKMLRANLRSCLFYVARSEFYVRPMIPPTFEHDAFTDPAQRVYLSATLGDAGELERAFGRDSIARVPVPEAWDRTGSGRRFFVFPSWPSHRPSFSRSRRSCQTITPPRRR
jgi:hypothetical protein